jgi:hypothetical protein
MNAIFRTSNDFFAFTLALFCRILQRSKPQRRSVSGRFGAYCSWPAISRSTTIVINSATGERSLSGLTKSEAEELLDWLEITGCQNRTVCQDAEAGFAVRWRQPR